MKKLFITACALGCLLCFNGNPAYAEVSASATNEIEATIISWQGAIEICCENPAQGSCFSIVDDLWKDKDGNVYDETDDETRFKTNDGRRFPDESLGDSRCE